MRSRIQVDKGFGPSTIKEAAMQMLTDRDLDVMLDEITSSVPESSARASAPGQFPEQSRSE